MIRIVPFGGCFVNHPVNYISTKFKDQSLFTRMGLKSSVFGLSANMNIQMVEYLTHEIEFPEWLKNIAYSKFLEQPSKEQGKLLYECDLALVGLSTPIELVFDGVILNVHNFETYISSELSSFAADRKVVSNWRGALFKSNPALLKQAAEDLYNLIPRDTPERENLANFVRGTLPRTLSIDEMTEATAKLRDKLGMPMAFILYNFMWMPDGRVVQWPAGFKDDCIEVARRLDLRTLDYAPFVAKHGVDKMLMDDRRHFTPPAFPVLGEFLYEFCLEVLDRPQSAKQAAAIEQTSAGSAAAAEQPKKGSRKKKSATADIAALDEPVTLEELAASQDAATPLAAASSAGAAALAGNVDPDTGARRRYVLDDLTLAEFGARLHARKIARVLRDIEAAWGAEDYAGVARRTRDFLELEPDNTQGLIYLARAAAFVGDWADVARAGAALTRASPSDAFVAAGKLNRAGRPLEAAKIFVELNLREDWFDDEARSTARKDARLLLKAGMAAGEREDVEAERFIWVAGARLAPQSQYLTTRARMLAVALKNTIADFDFENDPDTYVGVYREMLWLNPANMLAAVRLARALDRSNEKEAIDVWLKVLAVDPDHRAANIQVRRLVKRRGLEEHVIQGLLELGWDEDSAPFLRELIDLREAKARAARDEQLRKALQRAAQVQRDSDPEAYLKAWKDVLALDRKNLGAAKRVIGGAAQAADYPSLVDALIIHLEIMPGDAVLGERLAAAAVRAGQEQRVLEYLVSHGHAELLSKSRLEGLRSRVFGACRSALVASDYSLARVHFRTLALVDDEHPSLGPLGVALANGLASSANEAERREDFTEAVLLAEQALELVPDHPLAVTLVARDLWREERFTDLMEFCQPRVKPEPAYDAVQTLLERAALAA
jgi:hypothetical protein